jgi:hypothetical protein
LQAVLDCNPRALIAGAGPNFARNHTLAGAHLLGFYVRRLVETCPAMPPEWILKSAKTYLHDQTLKLQRSHRKRNQETALANADALQFELYS